MSIAGGGPGAGAAAARVLVRENAIPGMPGSVTGEFTDHFVCEKYSLAMRAIRTDNQLSLPIAPHLCRLRLMGD